MFRMLPYDAEVLLSFLARYNEALWPLQPLALALGAAALLLAHRRLAGAWSGRLVALVLALGWAWVGWGFFLERFARFDFLAPLYGWAFLAEAALLAAVAALARPRVEGSSAFAGVGLALAGFALVVLPLAGPLAGMFGAPPGAGGWASAPLVGLMPGPTALFTLGLLLRLQGRLALPLALLPLLWGLVAGYHGWALGLWHGLVVAALSLVAAVLLAWRQLGEARGRG